MARNECTDAHHDLHFTSLRAKVGLMLFLVLLYMLILIFLTKGWKRWLLLWLSICFVVCRSYVFQFFWSNWSQLYIALLREYASVIFPKHSGYGAYVYFHANISKTSNGQGLDATVHRSWHKLRK